MVRIKKAGFYITVTFDDIRQNQVQNVILAGGLYDILSKAVERDRVDKRYSTRRPTQQHSWCTVSGRLKSPNTMTGRKAAHSLSRVANVFKRAESLSGGQ